YETAGIVSEAGKNLISLDPSDGSHPIAWVMQSGATWFRPEGEGWIVDMTDDASTRVAEFWDQIFAEQLVGTGDGCCPPPWCAAAADGAGLADIGASWSDARNETVRGGEGKWAAAPMPVWANGMGYASGGHGGSAAAILANSSHAAESPEFLTW